MKTINILINEIKTDETLQKLLVEAVKNKALDSFLKDQGCEATAEEFIAALKEQAEQMDDAALNTVAGGLNKDEYLLSVMTMGLYCAVELVVSLTSTGIGEGSDGRVLCNDT